MAWAATVTLNAAWILGAVASFVSGAMAPEKSFRPQRIAPVSTTCQKAQ